jgi:hypothetical protein
MAGEGGAELGLGGIDATLDFAAVLLGEVGPAKRVIIQDLERLAGNDAGDRGAEPFGQGGRGGQERGMRLPDLQVQQQPRAVHEPPPWDPPPWARRHQPVSRPGETFWQANRRRSNLFFGKAPPWLRQGGPIF